MGDRNAFAGFKQRLARGAAGLNAMFTDDAVREKAGALLQRNINRAVERGTQAAGAQLGACAAGARGRGGAGARGVNRVRGRAGRCRAALCWRRQWRGRARGCRAARRVRGGARGRCRASAA
jgi:hypothetical protein